MIPDAHDGHHQYGVLKRQKEMLLVGIGYEMPVIRPSYPELSAAIGCCHTTAMNHLDEWRRMNWQDRYGWLRLVDGRLKDEAHSVDAAVLR